MKKIGPLNSLYPIEICLLRTLLSHPLEYLLTFDLHIERGQLMCCYYPSFLYFSKVIPSFVWKVYSHPAHCYNCVAWANGSNLYCSLNSDSVPCFYRRYFCVIKTCWYDSIAYFHQLSINMCGLVVILCFVPIEIISIFYCYHFTLFYRTYLCSCLLYTSDAADEL